MPLRFGMFLLMAAVGVTGAPAVVRGEESLRKRGLDGMASIPLSRLSHRVLSHRGRAALGMESASWRHGESDNFIYHYFNSYVATPVSVEAEFFHRVIAADLRREPARGSAKAHIFLFEEPELWARFQTGARLDPWTGGLHAGNELFLLRDRARKFKGRTLGHEVAHLVLHRLFPNPLPLWLSEGYAEYIAITGYASFHRARGYAARPRSPAVPPDGYMPLRQLTDAASYPTESAAVQAFYIQSERLVRFLSGKSKESFRELMEMMGKGTVFETALARSYQGMFRSIADLEDEFQPYAVSP